MKTNNFLEGNFTVLDHLRVHLLNLISFWLILAVSKVLKKNQEIQDGRRSRTRRNCYVI